MNSKRTFFNGDFKKKPFFKFGLFLILGAVLVWLESGRQGSVLHTSFRRWESQEEFGASRSDDSRPAQWSGKVGSASFSMEPAASVSDEISRLTMDCPISDWKKDWTPLHEAAAFGDFKGMRRAMEKGTPIDASPEFLTPLHVAVIFDEEGAARYLLQKGANLKAKTFNGESVSALAFSCHHPNLGRLLTAFLAAETVCRERSPVTVTYSDGNRAGENRAGENTAGGGRAGGLTKADLTDELTRIAKGFKDEHRHDGTVFLNHEGKLPRQDRYYYTEFVHRVNDERSPGACRIVIGAKGDVWFTPDHYNTFVRVDE